MKMTVNKMKCISLSRTAIIMDYYGGNDRIKQLRRRSEWYEIG